MSLFSFAAPARRLLLPSALIAQLAFGPGVAAAAEGTAQNLGIGPVQAQAAPAGIEVPADLQAELWAALRRARMPSVAPGLSMSVVTADGRQWSGSDGWHANGAWLNPHDTLLIGSVTKTFTAAIVLALADEGRIQLDVPTTTYLPNVRLVKGTTVRQLLSHTSGIPDLYGPAKGILHGAPHLSLTPNGVLWPIEGKLFAPGTAYAYSNTNYFLLGMIIQTVTGRSVSEELGARFTGPLGLAHTRLLTAADTQLPPAWTTAFWTSGAMVSTPTELARWGQALYSGHAISATSLRRMLDFRGGFGYGEGAQLLPLGDRRVPGHSGLLYDTTTLLVYLPAERLTIAIAGTAPHTDLEAALTESYDGGPSLLDLVVRLAG